MNLTPTSKPHRQHRPSRPILATAVASVILGATFAAWAGTSSAEPTTAKTTTAALPMSAGPWSPGPGWAESAQGPWRPAIRPHRVLPCRIDRPVRPGHHHHHRGGRRRGHRTPGASHRRRNLRQWQLPHRPQCRASQCPLQCRDVRGDHQPDGTVQCHRRDRPVLRPRRQRHVCVPRSLHHRSRRQRLHQGHNRLHREHRRHRHAQPVRRSRRQGGSRIAMPPSRCGWYSHSWTSRSRATSAAGLPSGATSAQPVNWLAGEEPGSRPVLPHLQHQPHPCNQSSRREAPKPRRRPRSPQIPTAKTVNSPSVLRTVGT